MTAPQQTVTARPIGALTLFGFAIAMLTVPFDGSRGSAGPRTAR